jgi:hypothetical protein
MTLFKVGPNTFEIYPRPAKQRRIAEAMERARRPHVHEYDTEQASRPACPCGKEKQLRHG